MYLLYIYELIYSSKQPYKVGILLPSRWKNGALVSPPISQSVGVAQNQTLTHHISNQGHQRSACTPGTRQADNWEPSERSLTTGSLFTQQRDSTEQGKQRRTSQWQLSAVPPFCQAAQPWHRFAGPAQQTKVAVHAHPTTNAKKTKLAFNQCHPLEKGPKLCVVSHEHLRNPRSEHFIPADLPSLKSMHCMKSVVSLEVPDFANTNSGHHLHSNFK